MNHPDDPTALLINLRLLQCLVRSHLIPLLLSLVLLPSCAHVPYDGGYSGPEPLPAAVSEHFAVPEGPVGELRTVMETHHAYEVHRVNLVLQNDSEPIVLEYYTVPGDAPTPVIVVLPILEGRNIFARIFAKDFARHGYAAVIVNTTQMETIREDLERPGEAIQRSVQRHRIALDWVEQQRELDTDRLGVLGISLGGLNAAMLTAVDDRVDAAAVMLTGGDLPYIFTHSKEDSVRRAARRTMEDLNLDKDGFREYLEERIPYDPLRLAPYMDAASTLLVAARFDSAVPYRTQQELRQAMGGPKTIVLPTGHLSSLVFLPYIRRQAREFFRERFE